ncbi:MAG TPA: hypothetical protein VHG30_08960 [Microvirga sp.]|nr:hypothetical protein [Microvirga sp.]
MSIWAAVLALLAAVGALWADPMTVVSGAAEVAAVLALFTIVCAAEAWN